MSNQRETPEQWKADKYDWSKADTEAMDNDSAFRCILELRDRVEALEAKRSGAVGMSIADEILVYHSLLAAQSPVKAVFHGKAAVETTPPPVATDEELAPLLRVLWHHQGGGSTVGQTIRKYLGMGQFERMSDQQIEVAKRWAQSNGPASSREVAEPAPVAGGLVERVKSAIDSVSLDEEAHAAILEQAEWLREQGWKEAADLLEQEAGR